MGYINWTSKGPKGVWTLKSMGVNWLIKITASHAIIYRNNTKYAGLMNLQTMIYFLPNNKNPKPRMIQNEKANAVLR